MPDLKQQLRPAARAWNRPHLFCWNTYRSRGQTTLILDFTLICFTKTLFLVLLYAEEGWFFGKSKSVNRFYGHLCILFIAHYMFSILILKKIDHYFVVHWNHIFFKPAYTVATSLVGHTRPFLLFELYFMWFNCSVYLHGNDRALILLQKNKRINEWPEWQNSKMPFRQYHTSVFWSTQIIWKLPHSQTQVMTEFLLKDEVILLSLISVSPQAALLLYLWSCLHLSIFGLKMESFPESSHFLASLNLLYLMLQNKENTFFL